MIAVGIKVDTSEFDRAMRIYSQLSQRAGPEIVNTKAYYVNTAAVRTTPAADKGKIEAELRAQARVGRGPLVALLVNATRGAKGLKGLNGPQMTAAINKFIKARQRTVNYERSGWIPGIKILAPFVARKRGNFKGIKNFGGPQGGASPATNNNLWTCTATIWNSVTGGKPQPGLNHKSNPAHVQASLEEGLQKAIANETAEMWIYIKRKQEEIIRKASHGH